MNDKDRLYGAQKDQKVSGVGYRIGRAALAFLFAFNILFAPNNAAIGLPAFMDTTKIAWASTGTIVFTASSSPVASIADSSFNTLDRVDCFNSGGEYTCFDFQYVSGYSDTKHSALYFGTVGSSTLSEYRNGIGLQQFTGLFETTTHLPKLKNGDGVVLVMYKAFNRPDVYITTGGTPPASEFGYIQFYWKDSHFIPIAYNFFSPTGTSTPTITCDPNSGFFQSSFCNLFQYLFIPDQSYLDQIISLRDQLLNKPPIGYFLAIKNSFNNLTASSTPAYNLSIPAPILNTIITPIRVAMTWILWIYFAIYLLRTAMFIKL